MNKTFQKKGAVEMSLNLIIMLVIGLTLMGLVIGFVTSFLGNAEDKFAGTLTEDDQVKIDEVKRESGNFAFSSSSLVLEQGSKTPAKLYVKIRNPYTDILESSESELTGSTIVSYLITEGSVDQSGGSDKFTIYSPPFLLNSGESDGYPLEVYPNTAPTGTYYVTFSLEHSDGSTVEKKVLTFTVK
jgi:hypothetical protein